MTLPPTSCAVASGSCVRSAIGEPASRSRRRREYMYHGYDSARRQCARAPAAGRRRAYEYSTVVYDTRVQGVVWDKKWDGELGQTPLFD